MKYSPFAFFSNPLRGQALARAVSHAGEGVRFPKGRRPKVRMATVVGGRTRASGQNVTRTAFLFGVSVDGLPVQQDTGRRSIARKTAFRIQEPSAPHRIAHLRKHTTK